MNFPLPSWVANLKVDDKVTYHYTLGAFPAIIENISDKGIWIEVETTNGTMLARVGTDGQGLYSSYITERVS